MINEYQAFYLLICTILNQSQNADTTLKNALIFLNDYKNRYAMSYDINFYELKEMVNCPAIHRFPNKMALYIHLALCRIREEYNGSAINIFCFNNQLKDENGIVEDLCKFKGISNHKAILAYFILKAYVVGKIDGVDYEKMRQVCVSIEVSLFKEIDYLKVIEEY